MVHRRPCSVAAFAFDPPPQVDLAPLQFWFYQVAHALLGLDKVRAERGEGVVQRVGIELAGSSSHFCNDHPEDRPPVHAGGKGPSRCGRSAGRGCPRSTCQPVARRGYPAG